MSHNECCHLSNTSVHQTLNELDFERGIWYAAQNNDEERVTKLLKQGTDVNIQDSAGYTALHYAARWGHTALCRVLLTAGANIDSITRSNHATALHRASSMGKTCTVELLLEKGANIQLLDADGKSALHRAVEGGSADICRLLLRADLSLKDIKDNRGRLPMELIQNNTEIADVFNSFQSS